MTTIDEIRERYKNRHTLAASFQAQAPYDIAHLLGEVERLQKERDEACEGESNRAVERDIARIEVERLRGVLEEIKPHVEVAQPDSVAPPAAEALLERLSCAESSCSLCVSHVEAYARAHVLHELEQACHVEPLDVPCDYCKQPKGIPCWDSAHHQPCGGNHRTRFASAIRRRMEEISP